MSSFYKFKVSQFHNVAIQKQFLMKKCAIYVLSVWLIISFIFATTQKVFSQTSQQDHKINTADSITVLPKENSGYVSGMTTGRARSLLGTAVSLISLIAGWRAKTRSGRTNSRTGATVALILGLTGITLCLVHLSATAGAVFGSGSGKAGSIVGLLLGFTGVVLGWLALRSHNSETDSGNV